MKCNYCGSEWNVNSGISVSIVDCPFCGRSLLTTKRKFETVEDVLIEINHQYGVNILADEKKLVAYFSDLAPHLSKQRRILGYFVECGGHRRIIAVLSATKDEQDICIKQIVKEMKEEMYVEECAAQMICDSFFGAISGKGLMAGGTVSTTEKMKESAEAGSTCKEINFEMNADGQEATRWYTMAVQANDAYSQFMLGDCYVLGKGVEKNYEKAAYWYSLSANQGELRAKCNLGILYENGKGVSQDVVKAFALYEESAKAGASYGLLQLGLCYLRGIGTEKDTNEAYKLIYQAATLGEEYAQFKIAEGIENGTWGGQDRTKAFYWYKKSADQGFLDAQTEVGRCYEKGYGTIQSDFEAAHWYQKAADRGDRVARYRLEKLDKKKNTAERVTTKTLSSRENKIDDLVKNKFDLPKDEHVTDMYNPISHEGVWLKNKKFNITSEDVYALVEKWGYNKHYLLCKGMRNFEKQVMKAKKNYAPYADCETPMLMLDYTICGEIIPGWGTAKKGFVLTDQNIYYDLNDTRGKASLENIVSVTITKTKGSEAGYVVLNTNIEEPKLSCCNDCRFFAGTEESLHKLQKFWKTLLHLGEDPFDEVFAEWGRGS